MLIVEQLKLREKLDNATIIPALAKKLNLRPGDLRSVNIHKRAIDARKKPDLMFIYNVSFACDREAAILKNKRSGLNVRIYEPAVEFDPANLFKDSHEGKTIAVAGFGPAGIFCAYCLALAGFKPLVFERGKSVDDRTADVEDFWKTGKLLLNSNVSFGEGGAGTFSDGKLNTQIKDRSGFIHFVLKTFVKFGAPEEIIYDSKPHIGTDVLKKVIKNIRNEIINLGGEVRFSSQITDILIADDRIKAVYINDSERTDVDALILAIGHSARDTFKTLYEKGVFLEKKPFAVGFRVMHPQEMIDKSQYGFIKEESCNYPGAAPYKLATHVSNDRNVYSFCMCPGGYVVNASSEYNHTAINGMSYSGRDGVNANSAILVNVDENDFPGDNPLAGVDFQRVLEERAYTLGEGKIPYCRLGDFENISEDKDIAVKPVFKGQSKYADLKGLLPGDLEEAFVEGMHAFGKTIEGFDNPGTLVAAVESRSSSPVRITRDEKFESVNVKGLYPCGEGAGYAGGIVSAAVDGIKVFCAVLERN